MKTVSISNTTYIKMKDHGLNPTNMNKIFISDLLVTFWFGKNVSIFMKLWFSLVFHIIISHNFLRFIFGINLFARFSGFFVGDLFVW